MTALVPGRVHVRVPATSANLGPGFDALGLGLSVYDHVTAFVTDEGLHVDVHGEGADGVSRDESNLVVRSIRAGLAALDAPPTGLAVECRNVIPHSRGLGSSAAAIVAGLMIARALVERGAEDLGDTALLALASEMEGHPDNVAACLLGGLTIAWMDAGVARAIRCEVADTVRPVVLIPQHTASTHLARGLLPPTVSHADAAFSAGRTALLIAALAGAPDALLAATEDRLHQPFRAPAMPDSARLVQQLRGAGHPAVISGAGPSVLVLSRDADEVAAVLALTPDDWRGSEVEIDRAGAQLLADIVT